MAQDRMCRECGLPLPADAPGGVCPVCSLQSALKFASLPAAQELAFAPRKTPIPEDKPLSRFGDYELVELIARGGMGVVHKARQTSLNRTVALKMIQGGALASQAEVKRFQAEAEAIAQLNHPNIVAIHEVGEHQGQHFFSMDFVAGRTLADIARDGPLAATRAATYVKTTAEAVHYAHEHGIIHRDLKPANIIIDDQDQPRITDFGLAKRLSDSALSTTHFAVTVSGQVLGSPNYLPPEQADPKRGVPGPPSDVYALGAILYHLLTGRPPFQAESLTTLLRQVVETDPVPPRSLNPSISRDLETICLMCLAKEPRHRYATARALADDLARFLNHEPVRARPVSVGGKAWRWCRRQPVRAGLLGALALVLVLGVAGISWQWRRAERERRNAIGNEQLALRQAYAGDMNLAQRSLEEGDLKRARSLLQRYQPGRGARSEAPSPKSEVDLRGWEWRYLWGLCRSDDHSTLTLGSNRFSNLALAPDGRLVAARRENGNIELWDRLTRQHTGTLTNRSAPLAMGFSPDTGLLASANSELTGPPVIRFWDATKQEVVWNLGQTSSVAALAFSPDGKRLATFLRGSNPRFRLLEMPSGKVLTEWPTREGFNGIVPIALFSPGGKTLALGENQGQIRLLDLTNLTTGVTKEIPAPTEGNGVYALAFSPDGRLLASGYAWADSIIRLWDVATGRPVGCLEGQQKFVEKLVFAPDGQTLYSAGFDQSIRIWDVSRQKQIGRLQGHTDRITGLVLCPDGQTLISCSWDGSVRVWDLRAKAQPPAEELPVRVGLYGALFTADSRCLITASPSNAVTVWNAATAAEIDPIPELGTTNYSVALSPDQRLLAVGGLDGALKVWNLKTRRLVREWRPHRAPVAELCFLNGGTQLASIAIAPGLSAELKRFEVGTWREIAFDPADSKGCFGVAQSPDQRHFALIYGHKPLQVWDCVSGRLEATLGSEGGFTPVFSQDGRFVAAALRRCAQVWEVGSWRQVALLQLTANITYSVALSPDGNRLVVGLLVPGDSQPALRIWDYVVERELLALKGHGPFTSWIKFSPDGNSLLAVSLSGAVKLWRAPSWAEIEAAEKGAVAP